MPDKIASWFVLWMFIGAGLFGLVMTAPEESSEAFAAFAGGDGSASNPYQIATVEQLQAMKDHLDAHFVLVNDIDASVTRGWNGGAGFEPIGNFSSPFNGTFDGRGYKILGLDINRPSTDYVGLFGYTGSGSEIRNVSLEGISVRGHDYVGGLVGWNAGSITDSYSGGSVSGSWYVGGLAGFSWWGTIINSYFAGGVYGFDCVGGLVGETLGTIKHSHSTGSVNGSWYVGGLAGGNEGTIIDSYSTGSVNGSWYVGGLVGCNYVTNAWVIWCVGAITGSYAGGNVDGTENVGGLVGWNSWGTVTDSFSTGSVNGSVNVGGLVGWNDGGTIANSYSTGSVNGTENVGGLVGYNYFYSTFLLPAYFSPPLNVGGLVGYNYFHGVLGAHKDEAIIANSYSTGSVNGSKKVGGLVGWNSWWGTVTDSFSTGSVNGTENVGGLVGGNEGTITDSYSGGSVNGTENVGGLVGWNGGSITNSYFTGSVSGSDAVGGLVGWNKGVITNSKSTGSVYSDSGLGGGLVGLNEGTITDSYSNGSVYGNDYVGGLVGWNVGTIVNSYAGGSVNGVENVGGLVGYERGGTIMNSYSTGNVHGSWYVGGLVGYDWGGTIRNSYSGGNVYGSVGVGGLAGGDGGTIIDSYSTGSVSGYWGVGGLVGRNYGGTIKYSYSAGNVSGYWGVGGLVGEDYGGTVTSSYWDIQTSGQSTSDGGEGKTTAEMKRQATYAGWDFTRVWRIDDGWNYPYLQWEEGPPVITTADITVATEDVLYRVDYEATDPNNNALTWSLETNATWLSINTTSGVLSGTPTNADVGTYWVKVIVADGYGGFDWHNFTLRVFNANDAPEIITTDVTVATEDVLYRVDYEAIDVDPTSDILTWRLLTNATWLSIDSSTGILSGTPANADVGICWVNVSVSDGNGGIDWHNFTLTVFNVNDAPEIVTLDVTTATEDVLYRVDYEATDIDPTSDTLTWRLLTNASWLSIDPSTGVLSGMPTNADVGVYWVKVSVADGNGGFDWHKFTLTVVNVNDPPEIVTTDVTVATEDVLYRVNYEAIDVDPTSDTLTWRLLTNASWLSIDPSTGILSGTPANADVGVYWVNVSVSDGNGGVDWHNFTLRVVNVNDPPVIENAPLEIEVKAGEDYVLDFSGYVYDVDNATSELKLTTSSKYARISGLTIIFNYTATVSWEKVTITVSDGIGTATHTINVSVIGGEIEDGGETGDGGEIEEGDTDVTGKSSSFGIPGIILIIIHVGVVFVVLFLLMRRKQGGVESEK